MRSKDQQADFYVIYAKSGATFAKALVTQLQNDAPSRAKLEMVMDDPSQRSRCVEQPDEEGYEDALEKETKKLQAASFLILLITPGVFECAVSGREAALALMYRQPIVMVQHVRSCPFVWRELEKAPVPLQRSFETAMWRRTLPLFPYVAEYAGLLSTFLLELHPRLRPFTPERSEDAPPGVDAISPDKFETALRMLAGRRAVFIYGSSGKDVASAIRYQLLRTMSLKGGRPLLYDFKVKDAGDIEEHTGSTDSHSPFAKSPVTKSQGEDVDGKLPLLSVSRGLLRTWSSPQLRKPKGPNSPKGLPDSPTRSVPSIEASVSIIFLVLTAGILADQQVLDAIASSWKQTASATLVLVQDLRSVHCLTEEMTRCLVPPSVRTRLLASFTVPFLFKFGALAALDRMVRLRILPPSKMLTNRPRFACCGPDVLLLHTATLTADWAYILQQELQRQAPHLGCFLDVDQQRDHKFLKSIAVQVRIICILVTPGFLSNDWILQVLEFAWKKNVKIVIVQPLHLLCNLEFEIGLAMNGPKTDGEGKAPIVPPAAISMQKRHGLVRALRRVPLLSFVAPGLQTAADLARLAESTEAEDLASAGDLEILTYLKSIEDRERAQSGLCSLANVTLFDCNMEIQGAASVVQCLSEFSEDPDVAFQGLRVAANLGLHNSGSFLDNLVKEGGVPLIEQIADKYASKSEEIRKQLCILWFAIGKDKERKKAFEKSPWLEQVLDTKEVPGWINEFHGDKKIEQLQAAADFQKCLANVLDKAPPPGFSSVFDAPGVLNDLLKAHQKFQCVGEDVDLILQQRAASVKVPCMKCCGWQGSLKDMSGHTCTRSGSIVVPTEVSTIQEAIDSVPNDSSKPTTIFLRPGQYPEALRIDRPVHLVGDGNLTECILQAKDQSAITFLKGCGSSDVTGVSLRSVGSKAASALSITFGAPTVIGCDICSTTSSGIHIKSSSKADLISPIIVQNVIHNCEGYGVVFSNGAKGCCEENTIESNKSGGVLFSNCQATKFTNNHIRKNAGAGVVVENPDGLLAKNAQGSPEFTLEILSNTITDNDSEGVSIGDRTNVSLRMNVIENNSKDGALIKGSAQVEENDICRNSSHGLELGGAARAQLQLNHVAGNDGFGILLHPGSTGHMLDNEFLDNEAGAIEAKEGSTVVEMECATDIGPDEIDDQDAGNENDEGAESTASQFKSRRSPGRRGATEGSMNMVSKSKELNEI